MAEAAFSPDHLHPFARKESVLAPPGGAAAGDRLLAAIRRHARTVTAGMEIAFEGDRVDSVTWVLGGWVALSKMLDDGRRQIVDIVVPVDVIGAAAAGGTASPCGITALTDGVVASWSLAELARRRAQFAALGGLVDRLSAAASARQAERMLRLGQGTACERVAHALLELFLRLQAVGQTDGRSFRLPVTQREFGDFIGLTSVHVCRTLRRLSRDRLIVHRGHKISIRNIDDLARIARLDVPAYREQIIPASI